MNLKIDKDKLSNLNNKEKRRLKEKIEPQRPVAKRHYLCYQRLRKRGERGKCRKKSEEIRAENFSNVMNEINVQIQEAQ